MSRWDEASSRTLLHPALISNGHVDLHIDVLYETSNRKRQIFAQFTPAATPALPRGCVGTARQAPGEPAAVCGAAALLHIVLESAEEASANYVERR